MPLLGAIAAGLNRKANEIADAITANRKELIRLQTEGELHDLALMALLGYAGRAGMTRHQLAESGLTHTHNI